MLGGALVVLLWTLVPFGVGVAFDSLRRSLSSAFDELEHARDAAERSEQASLRLGAFSRALAGARTTADVARAVADEGAAACGARAATVLAPVGEPGSLRRVAVSRLPAELMRPAPEIYTADRPIVATQALLERRLVVVRGRDEIRRRFPASDAFWGAEPIEAIVALPLEFGELLGVITFSFEHRAAAGDERLVFFQELAREAAEALERARLFEASEESRERMETLVETSPLPVFAFDVAGRDDALEPGRRTAVRLARRRDAGTSRAAVRRAGHPDHVRRRDRGAARRRAAQRADAPSPARRQRARPAGHAGAAARIAGARCTRCSGSPWT